MALFGLRNGQAQDAASAAAEAQAPADPASQAYQAAIEDAELLDGLLPIYRKPDGLLCELSAEHLDRPYLLFSAIKTGIGQGLLVSGLEIFDEWVVAFHRQGQRIEFRRLNTRFYSSRDAQLGWVVEEGYGDSIVAALPILAEHPESGAVLIDLAGVFFQDLPDLTSLVRMHFPVPYMLDPSRSAWGGVKVFPLNVELDVQHTFVTDQYIDLGSVPDSRALPLTLRYSLVEPPDPAGFVPRLADDRVGLWLTAMKDLSKPDSEEGFVRYVSRWRIEKADPAAARSAPKQPLVFYLDRSVPFRFRPAVRRGILEWNKAFEKIGILDAIEVRFQPDGADWDAEDIRYSTVRWSTEAAFGGVGPLRMDPRTGQIFDADILINAESLRGFDLIWRLAGSGGEGRWPLGRAAPGVLEPPGGAGQAWAARSADQSAGRGGAGGPQRASWIEERWRRGRICTLAAGFGEQVGFGFLALRMTDGLAPGAEPPAEFLDAAVKELVMHEFGHVLGLRHNFKGSTAVPVSRLHDVAYTREHGLSGSVMDYLPVNLAPPGTTQGEYFPSVLGPYDDWAIQYAYVPIPGAQSSEDEAEALAEIAGRSAEPALAFATDEDVFGPGAADPYANLFDLGSEPLQWARQSLEVSSLYLDEKLLDRVLADGERFQLARRIVFGLFVRAYRAFDLAARSIGGVRVTRIHKGQAPGLAYLAPLPASVQLDGLGLLGSQAFQDAGFALPPRLLALLPPETWSHWGVRPLDAGTTDFPLGQLVQILRDLLLDSLLSPAVLGRIQNGERILGEESERFTLAELFRRLSETIWAELLADVPAPGGEMVSSHRRGLQRSYLERLIRLALAPPPATPQDATALARLELVELQRTLRDALSGDSLGPLTEAHLRECLRLSERALEAKADLPPR
jgi:hypothetical protein